MWIWVKNFSNFTLRKFKIVFNIYYFVVQSVKEILFIMQKLVKAYRLYNGVDPFTELSKISGRFYIAKPKIYMRRSTRTKEISYIEIIAQLPQSHASEPPEYLIIIAYRSLSKMRPRDLRRVMKLISARLKKLNMDLARRKHIFIYLFPRKATSGVYEEIKRVYARARQNNLDMVIKITEPKTVLDDLRKYIEARLKGLLDKKKYRKSDYEVFSYPKRLIEYFLILDALLARQENIAEHIAMIAHSYARVPIDTYVKALYEINNIKEEIRSKEIRSPAIPYPYL